MCMNGEIIRVANGSLEMDVMAYGCRIVSLRAPDRDGRPGDVVLGFSTLEGYIQSPMFFGALVGRYGGRIANARFQLDGRTYQLTVNEPPNQLHGGLNGFDKAVWETERSLNGTAVTFRRTSPDGEEGYPGNLRVQATYTLTETNELVIDLDAETDAPTVVNLTQHSYFNLRGEGDILQHRLFVNADAYVAVDDRLLPLGVAPVDQTRFDFRVERTLGSQIEEGYDHTFALNRTGETLTHAARLRDPSSGRVLDIRTTEPGLQIYTAQGLDGSAIGKGGKRYPKFGGISLETQHFPDSPNHPEFDQPLLRPGERYRSRTVFAFSAE